MTGFTFLLWRGLKLCFVHIRVAGKTLDLSFPSKPSRAFGVNSIRDVACGARRGDMSPGKVEARVFMLDHSVRGWNKTFVRMTTFTFSAVAPGSKLAVVCICVTIGTLSELRNCKYADRGFFRARRFLVTR